MSRPQSSRMYSEQDSTMYDDTRHPEDSRTSYHRSSSRHDSSSWQDRRTPPRGPAAGTRGDSHYDDRGYRDRDDDFEHERGRRRSRSPHYAERRKYDDRDREGYRSRSRSRSPYYGAPASNTVILDGVPIEMTQEDGLAIVAVALNLQVITQLQNSYNIKSIKEVQLVKNKALASGVSRQLAFVQFPGISEARDFLEKNYPTIYVRVRPDAEGVQVRIAFSRDKVDRPMPGKSDGDWKCTCCYNINYSHRLLCFRCNAPKTRPTPTGVITGVPSQVNMSSYSGFATTGDSDVSPDNTPSQFLLLRGLEPGVNEELVAKGVCKLYKSSDTPPPTVDSRLPKKLKASSAKKDTNVGAKEGSLKRVLLVRDRKTDESWRYAFAEFATVEDAQYAMAKYNASEKFTISSKPVMVSYIHAGVFVPVVEHVVGDSIRFSISPLHNPSIKLMYWDQAAYVKELLTAEEVTSKESTNDKLAAAAANEGLVSSTKDTDFKVKKRKAEKEASGVSKKVIAPHLQFWTNRHAEIHGLPTKEEEEAEEASSKAAKKAIEEAPPSKSFADMNRKCCLLCSRQFKTDAEVNKHERMSELHRNNMKDDSKVKIALAKLAKSFAKETEEESAYRDRAKERRQAFNQPKQPAPQQHNKPKEQVKVEEEAAPTVSKGAALLGKMGWTAGEGLGAQGTGMTSTIQTDLYTQGVGLGAEGGKIGDALEEAQRNTKGNYQAFIDKTKDRAKERYEAMS